MNLKKKINQNKLWYKNKSKYIIIMKIDKYSIFIFLAISIYLYIAYKNSNIGLSYYDHNLNNSALDEEKDEILVEVLNQFNIIRFTIISDFFYINFITTSIRYSYFYIRIF